MKIQQMLLTPNKYSRPQIPLEKVTNIAVHYVGNPGSTAIANRNYFENQKNGGRYVSSHLIVGLSGEILQCIPFTEWSYCTNQANGYSISIECCHPDSTGKFTAATEKSLAELCAYLCEKFGLDPIKDIIRHYDVTGKQCPLYWSPTKYVTKAAADARFTAFKDRVRYIISNGETEQAGGKAVPAVPFKVRVVDSALNIRIGAGVSNKAVGVIRGGGVYTIVEVKRVGSSLWGKLKSGIGWVNIGEKYCKIL